MSRSPRHNLRRSPALDREEGDKTDSRPRLVKSSMSPARKKVEYKPIMKEPMILKFDPPKKERKISQLNTPPRTINTHKKEEKIEIQLRNYSPRQ